LSACETGQGRIEGSEGVFGLQSTFKLAGVNYIMASLWQVPDKETAEFMETFYSHWLGGKTIRQAFFTTQQIMRKKYAPYYWAGFTLVQ
jgi:CHAT domain-containing protein